MIPPKYAKYFNYLLIFIICIPILIYIRTVYHYAINIPWQDDYDAILDCLINYKKLSGFDKISFLFIQQEEHRILFLKSIVLSYYMIFGEVNFRHLVLINIPLLLTVFGVLVYFIKRAFPNSWQIPTLIISYGLFDLNNYENADCTAGLFNNAVIMLFLISILCYSSKNNKYIILGILMQIILIYSGGNGMIGALFIAIYAILDRSPKKYIPAIIVFLVCSPLYFYHYRFATGNAQFHTLEIKKVLPYFTTALGANFGAHFSVIGGVIMLLIPLLLYSLYRKSDINKQTLPFFCLSGFMIISLGIMAVHRANLPIEGAYSSRYFIYSHIIISMIFIFIFFKIKTKPLLIAASVFAVLVYCIHYKNGKNSFESVYLIMKNSDYAYPVNGKDHAKQIAEESCRQGIYCIEKHRAD